MKKISLTITLIGFFLGAFAQLGISGGMSLANYSYAEQKFNVHRKSILAYNFGIQYKKQLTEKLFLLPELNYSLKGSRIYYDYPIGITGPMKNLNRFEYIQLNLPAVVALEIADGIDYEIGGGLFAAYLLNATQKSVEFDGSAITRDFASGDLKKMDAGLHFTTGFSRNKMLGFHFRYDLGLMDIQGISGAPRVCTRDFSINISWRFSRAD